MEDPVSKSLYRDEMNFAEFPITLLSERAPRGVTTLEFEVDDWDLQLKQLVKRKLTVEGSQKHGLPTAKDDEVLLGLIQLTKSVTEFAIPTVVFTQRSLLQLLEWSDGGRSYSRLRKAFHRLQGVRLYYENAWKDNADKQYVTTGGFGVLSRFHLGDGRRRQRKGSSSGEPESVFEWTSVIHKSFQDGHLKKLDYELVKSFRYPSTKRLYRHLDKRFYPEQGRTQLTYELKTLAYQHVGITRRKDSSAIKDALEPAILELEEAGYIRAVSKYCRFRKVGSGNWNVLFTLESQCRRGPKAKKPNGHPATTRHSTPCELQQVSTMPAFLDQFESLPEDKRNKLVASALAHCDKTHPDIADGYRRRKIDDGESSKGYLELIIRSYLSAKRGGHEAKTPSDG